jgi:hypothetical protein
MFEHLAAHGDKTPIELYSSSSHKTRSKGRIQVYSKKVCKGQNLFDDYFAWVSLFSRNNQPAKQLET